MNYKPLIVAFAGAIILLLGAMAGFIFGRSTYPAPGIPPLEQVAPPHRDGIFPGEEDGVACTMDAKICPDGSAVGRVPPTCEFAACPGE